MITLREEAEVLEYIYKDEKPVIMTGFGGGQNSASLCSLPHFLIVQCPDELSKE